MQITLDCILKVFQQYLNSTPQRQHHLSVSGDIFRFIFRKEGEKKTLVSKGLKSARIPAFGKYMYENAPVGVRDHRRHSFEGVGAGEMEQKLRSTLS